MYGSDSISYSVLMKNEIIKNFFIFVLSLFSLTNLNIKASEIEIEEIAMLSINSAITPASFDYLEHQFENLPSSSLIVIQLNTPGGLVSTTKDIITLIGRVKRPVAIWITPEGASASSAGAIIASAAHFLFMSPGTNMGAATPVGLGEDIKESDGKKKAMSDLTAMVRSLCNSRARPAEPFEKMITTAESFTAQEALKLKIIDGIISNKEEIIPFISTKKISLEGAETSLKLKNPVFKIYEPTLGQKILEVLSNPSTAYILFLIGVALIYFEFQAPGGFIAGAVGVCFLILSGISFQVLPLHWGAMGLIIAGIFLLILEIFIVSYGILSLAGLTAFVIGSLFLFQGEGGFITIEYPVILSSITGIVVALGIILWYLFKDSQKNKVKDNFFLPIGAQGSVLAKLHAHEYQVKIRGEIWRAHSEETLDINDEVEVTEVDTQGLRVKIKKINH